METITNLASTAASTASKLIYGDTPAAQGNETAGKEPISGEQGKGTPNDPFDKGNAATPLEKPPSSSPFTGTSNNETAGKEPISGVQGKGTATEPFDQGNSGNPTDSSSSTFRPLDTAHTSEHEGNPADSSSSTFRPLDTAHTSESDSKPFGGTGVTGITDKLWKPTTVDNVSTSVITSAPVDPLTSEKGDSDHPFEKSSFDSFEKPGSSSFEKPSFASTEQSSFTSTEQSNFSSTEKSKIPVPVEKSNIVPTEKSSIPSVETAPLEYTYQGSDTSNKASNVHETDAIKDSNAGSEKPIGNIEEHHHDTTTEPSTGLSGNFDTSKPVASGETNRLAGEKSDRKSESTTSPVPASSTSNGHGDNHESKISHIKEKLMDKLHIGHK